MKTYDRSDPGSADVRAHPWTVATADSTSRYYDLKEAPGRIRRDLEDFLPWSSWPAIETFYQMLEWINGPESRLESNDCAFSPPCANSTPEFPRALEATGRLMILFRDLALNLARENVEWMRNALHRELAPIDPSLVYGVVATTIHPVRYVTLALPEEQQAGHQLMISFWAWGDTTAEVMENLARTLRALSSALRNVDQAAREVEPE